jgi:hypothetical protein
MSSRPPDTIDSEADHQVEGPGQLVESDDPDHVDHLLLGVPVVQ